MRSAHSIFGQAFNRIHKRSGKVANERPKTSLVENQEHALRVHFYIEANPVRANKIKIEKLRFYKYSSYRFYAYGEKDELTKHLKIPNWYLELGKTFQERQKNYRYLFSKYLEENLKTLKIYEELFIGGISWLLEKRKNLQKFYFKEKSKRNKERSD